MPSLSKTDLKSLLIGIVGAVCLGLLILAGYLSYYLGHRSSQKDIILTPQERQELIEAGTATGPSTLTEEEMQALIEAGTAR